MHVTESDFHYLPQSVRDFRWAIKSPSLISHTDGKSEINTDPIPTTDADDLQRFLADQSSHRVGYYFESLVHYWLLRILKVDCVGKGIQIQDGTRTIGELDFLYRDAQGQLTHLETAVKFYLHFPTDNPLEDHLIGPNAADTFQRKMRHLFEHQLPVSQQAYPGIQRRIAFVKGRIFYHPNQTPPTELPVPLADGHLHNTWLRQSEIRWFGDNHADGLFRILRKPHWLSDECVAHDDDSLLTSAELLKRLQTHFTRSNHPNLVSVLKPSESVCREVDRVFVVNNSWPSKDNRV